MKIRHSTAEMVQAQFYCSNTSVQTYIDRNYLALASFSSSYASSFSSSSPSSSSISSPHFFLILPTLRLFRFSLLLKLLPFALEFQGFPLWLNLTWYHPAVMSPWQCNCFLPLQPSALSVQLIVFYLAESQASFVTSIWFRSSVMGTFLCPAKILQYHYNKIQNTTKGLCAAKYH